MPWVRFVERFVWRPIPQQVVDYPAGFEGMVTTRCAEAAGPKVKQVPKPPNVRVLFGKAHVRD